MMLESIAKQLGPGFIVPTLAVFVMAWVAKLLFDLHTSSRQSRRDFLDIWRALEVRDDVALEVATRHLFGTYLPADAIRAIAALPFPTQKLARLATIWPHLQFDEQRSQLILAQAKLESRRKCFQSALVFLGGYFLLAMTGTYGLQFASKMPPSALVTWMVIVASIGSLIAAFVSLSRSDSLHDLAKWGLELIEAINATMAKHPKKIPPGAAPIGANLLSTDTVSVPGATG